MYALDFLISVKEISFKNSYNILDLEYLPRTVIPAYTGLLSVTRSLSSETESGSNYDSPTHALANRLETGVVYLYPISLSFMEMLLAPIPGVPSRNHQLVKTVH